MNGINNMKNSSELEKSKGVLLFAFNSKTTDYISITEQTSRLIRKNLNLPITLVTDTDVEVSGIYDTIIRVDNKGSNFRFTKDNKTTEWRNFDRYRAYELSPYYETLLIDTDYLVLDDSLLKLFEQPFDYRLMYKMQTPKGLNKDEMGPVSLPMVWATVALFRKTERAKLFFGLIGRIQRNYNYYRNLFGIREGSYRNDYAFSIANIIMNGYSLVPEQSIPWPMTTLEDDLTGLSTRNKFIVARFENRAEVIARQNLHIMDKKYLQSDNFKLFVESICNE